MTSQTEELRQEFEAWAKDYFKKPSFELDPDFDFYISFEIDVAWKAWQAAKTSKWISCSEQMPEDNKDYQLYCEDTDEQFVGYQIEEGRFCYANKAGGPAFVCKPSHWVTLPDPPK